MWCGVCVRERKTERERERERRVHSIVFNHLKNALFRRYMYMYTGVHNRIEVYIHV